MAKRTGIEADFRLVETRAKQRMEPSLLNDKIGNLYPIVLFRGNLVLHPGNNYLDGVLDCLLARRQ